MNMILQEIKRRVSSESPVQIEKIIFFGSRLRDINNDEADYDILILFTEPVHWEDRNRVRSIISDISIDHNIIIDSHFISQDELETPRGRQPYITEALEHGAIL